MRIFMSDATAASLGAVAELAGQSMAIAAQADLAESTREWNEKMWNKANEYNSPTSQISRLKEAGLNPNLFYGSINSGNTSNLKLDDAYNSKGIGAALSKLDYQALALNIAKSKQELEGMKLDNARKHYEVMNESYIASDRAARLQGLESYANGLGYRISPDSSGIITPEGNLIETNNTTNPASIAYMLQFQKDLDFLSQKTTDLQTKQELNFLKKKTQELINQFKSVENAWQPWQYGVGMGTQVLNGVVGAFKPFVSLKRPPIRYVSPYNH